MAIPDVHSSNTCVECGRTTALNAVEPLKQKNVAQALGPNSSVMAEERIQKCGCQEAAHWRNSFAQSRERMQVTQLHLYSSYRLWQSRRNHVFLPIGPCETQLCVCICVPFSPHPLSFSLLTPPTSVFTVWLTLHTHHEDGICTSLGLCSAVLSDGHHISRSISIMFQRISQSAWSRDLRRDNIVALEERAHVPPYRSS